MTELTRGEWEYLDALRAKVEDLSDFLDRHHVPATSSSVYQWFQYVSSIRDNLGNINNGVSFLACLMAKDYLCRKFAMRPFDAAAKPQGAPGLDIDELTVDGKRVIGEIKTTVPYLPHDLGAAQKKTFQADFDKLNAEKAAHKFFFVTNSLTFQLMKAKYYSHVTNATIVNVVSGEEYITPDHSTHA